MYKAKLKAIVLAALACALVALPALAESHVRIVRLSDVQGAVQIDKGMGLGFENAFINLPIIEGTQVRSRGDGRAEIEFEDGSSLRIAPGTTVRFSRLGLNDAGKRVSTVDLMKGRAYVNWLGKSGDDFSLHSAAEKIELSRPAHFRVESDPKRVEIASFKNELEVETPAGAVKVEKNRSVSFDADQGDKPLVAKLSKEDSYDAWDKQAIEYHDQYASSKSAQNGYGFSDLNYYGTYNNLPGYGMLWQPFFAGAGWNPFMDGAWSWYPGMGYMWASAYPWGWMPYNYGSWIFAPGFGWGWQPGGFSAGQGGLHYVGAAVGFRPPVAPVGSVATVAVGKGGAVKALVAASGPRMVVRGGSAGLGIPRGSFDGLRRLNSQVEKTGFVEVHPTAQFSATASRNEGFGFGAAHPTSMGEAGHGGAASSGHAAAAGGHGGRY